MSAPHQGQQPDDMSPGHTSAAPAPASASAPKPISDPSVTRPGGFALGFITRGLVGIAFGIATVFWPREGADPRQLTLSVGTVDVLLAVYLGLTALLLLWQSRSVRDTLRTALLGQAVIVVPAVIFLLLATNPGQLRGAVCIWALLHAALEVWLYYQRRSLPMASDFLISAGCHGLIGIIFIFGDDMGPLTVLGFTGAATLISGLMFVLGGMTLRGKLTAAKTRESAAHPTDPATEDDDS